VRTAAGIGHPHWRRATALGVVLLAFVPAGRALDAAFDRCTGRTPSPLTKGTLGAALRSPRDVLGDRLVGSAAGPTYEGVRRLLPPLWYARGRNGSSLTRSQAYYLVFAYPLGLYGEKAFALHVADGSEILTRRTDGPSLALFVGTGRERFGTCLGRLAPPRLGGGYLPILKSRYVDARGVRYDQESFAGRVPNVPSLVSFVRLSVDARGAAGGHAVVRFVPSPGSGSRLVTDGGGDRHRGSVRYDVEGRAVIHVAWVHRPVAAGIVADAHAYQSSRAAMTRFWETELARGVTFEVPERRLMNAQRHLLVQQRILTWRYSVGHNYEELSFAEALDAARVMAAYGHTDVSRAILRFALRRLPHRYTNWRAGAVLLATANHVLLTGDGSLLESEAPTYAAVLGRLERQIHRPGGTGLLDREAFSSDIRRPVIALHGQTVVWQGLLAMGRAWARVEHPRLTARANAAAFELEQRLRSAVRASQRRLPDGSLFVPAALLDDASPFDLLTATREGSYWNLVMPYALASGFFEPTSREAEGIWHYMRNHGSRFLGLVRADAQRLYRGAPFPSTGVDQVYGLNMARFLADADAPDELVLSLYGALAGAMTRDTFVSGEAATVAPLAGLPRGAMYLPPNGGGNTALLETLRIALVHERSGRRGAPVGLELAFATPRAWLEDGKAIRVQGAPTSFGSVSYTVVRRGRTVEAVVDAPSTPSLKLRLRLPGGDAIAGVTAGGRALPFDRVSGTIDLSHRRDRIPIVVRLRR
jgi:hypothetical protein